MNDKIGKLDTLKFHFDNMKFIWEKIKLQREVMDRYFHYFLLFVTTPIAVLVVLVSKMNSDLDNILIAVICILLSIIGCSFFFMYVMQRINSLKLVIELKLVETFIAKINGTLINEQDEPKKDKPQFATKGADFWVSIIHAVISSFWFGSGVFFMVNASNPIIYKKFACPSLLITLLIVIIQILILFRIRHNWLRKYESI